MSNRSCPHYPGGIKNAPITCRFGFVFEENSVRDTCMIIETGHPLFSSLEGGRERTLGASSLVPRGKALGTRLGNEVHRKTQCQRFQILPFEERFRKAPFS